MAPVIPFHHDRNITDSKFKKLVVRYLEGEYLTRKPASKYFAPPSIQHELETLCNSSFKNSIDAKELCNSVAVIQEDNFDEDTIAILEHLNMPTSKFRYIGATSSLYHLLSRLRNEGHERLDYLLELIDNTRCKERWEDRATRPALILFSLLAFCYIEPELFWSALDWIVHTVPLLYHSLYQHFVELHNLPILGMLGQVGWGLYYLFETFEYGLDQSDKRIHNWMFNTFAVMLNFSAHLVSYWATGTLPLLPALLFILSAWVDIVKFLYITWNEKIPLPAETFSSHQNATLISMKKFKERDKEIFIANCIHATAVTILVLGCYFLTPSIILTITYTLALWIGLITKNIYIKETQQTYIASLQKDLRAHYQPKLFGEATAHQAFREYAKTLLASVPTHTAKYANCIEYRDTLLETKPFYLRKNKDKFQNYCENWDQIAESIQKSSLSYTPSMIRKLDSSSNSLFYTGSRENSFALTSPNALRISPEDQVANYQSLLPVVPENIDAQFSNNRK